jgi:uncharacterized protein YndB with AHSA1/START domain
MAGMSEVDVTVHIEIAADPAAIAGVMFDPHRQPEWIEAITAVAVQGPGLEPGARARVTGQFMGRPVAWVSEILAVESPHHLSIKLEGGPFVGTVSYRIAPSGVGSGVTVRHHGETTVMAFLPASVVEGPIRAILAADLARLKQVVETNT